MMSKDASVRNALPKLLFKKLSTEEHQALSKPLNIQNAEQMLAPFTTHVVTTERAAATLSTHFTSALAALLPYLEKNLFLGGDRPCLADAACYVACHAIFAAYDDQHKWALASASRWYDLLQHRFASIEPPPKWLWPTLVSFNLDPPDGPTRVADLRPLIGDGGAVAAAEAPVLAAAEELGGLPSEDKGAGKKKEKKEKKPAAEPTAPAAPAPPDISKIDFRVGLILTAEKHPEADKCYVETVDLGEAAPRTVVSGLVPFMPAEALAGKRAVLVCNLKAAKVRGIESQAMVLAASNADHTVAEILVPPEGAAVGERITFEGFVGEAAAPNVVNKKKLWEAIVGDLRTDEGCVATWGGVPFMTSAGPCRAATQAKATIK